METELTYAKVKLQYLLEPTSFSIGWNYSKNMPTLPALLLNSCVSVMAVMSFSTSTESREMWTACLLRGIEFSNGTIKERLCGTIKERLFVYLSFLSDWNC